MIRLLLYFLCFIIIHFVSAESNKCTTAEPEKGKKRLCFFALNGPEEHQRIKKAQEGLNCIQPSDGLSIKCGHKHTEEGENVSLEIQEFYADVRSNESVSKAFEDMTKTRCDGLVISGHHVGYYTGDQTIQEKTAQGARDASKVTLNLKFLEKLSCLQGGADSSDCRKWFSNIRYVHLHGSHTSGDKVLEHEGKSDVDALALSKMKKYDPQEWTSKSSLYLNREYASTVDENNSLSSRYLKMFPSAQIYSWAVAPTIDQGSPETFIEHLKLITAHTVITGEKEGSTPDESRVLENILNILSVSSEPEPKCIKLTMGDKRGTEINAIPPDNKEEDRKRKIGCDFSEAIEAGDREKIMTALDHVLEAGVLRQNLNRIFHALNYDSPLGAGVKQAIRGKLQTSKAFQQALEGQVNNKRIGVVKRADALYLYKQIYPADYKSGDLENQFIGDLISLYDQQGADTIGAAMKGMIAELIWKNNLGSSPAARANMQTLVGKIGMEDNDVHLRQHTELMKISSGLYKPDTSQVEEIFEELFKKDKDEFKDSEFFIRVWTDLQAQNEGDFTPIQALYKSALTAWRAEKSDPAKKEKLNRKFSNIVWGIGSGFAVRKEECLKKEFPLNKSQLKVEDEHRDDMTSFWKEICNR